MLAFLRIDVNKAMNVNKQIYLDYQATTPVAREVVDAMLPYFTENFGNPHSTQHEVGRASSAAVEQARKKVATMINAEPHEIIFTSVQQSPITLPSKV